MQTFLTSIVFVLTRLDLITTYMIKTKLQNQVAHHV